MTIVNVLESNPSILVPTIPSLVVTLLVAGLVWTFGRWALIVAAIFAILAGLVNGGVLAYGLDNLESFFDFVPPVLLSGGFLLAFVGGITAFIERRAASPRTTATAPERGIFGAIGAALVALAIV